ncbi:TRAP transporter substrate-binding protein DctP [Rhodococcus sp. T2V]|nr:TRAP transporter substrate-binding protein DctP [Rhodococcus sp. T2V]
MATACGEVGGGSDTTTLKVANFLGSDSSVAGGFAAWESAITEATNGAVTFKNFDSGSLLGPTEQLQGVKSGVADVGLVVPSYYPQDLPVNNWIQGMGAAVSASPVRALTGDAFAAYQFSVENEQVRDEYLSQGLIPLGTFASPAYHPNCSKAVTGPSEAQGLKARTSGNLWSAPVEAMGMTTVSVAYDELYEALERGVVDCGINSFAGTYEQGFADVAPHLVPITLPQTPNAMFVFNKDAWDRLDPAVQQAISDASSALIRGSAERQLEIVQEGAKTLIGKKLTVDDPGTLGDIAAAAAKKWLASMADRAPDSVDNPAQVITQYQAMLDHWSGVMDELGYPEPANVDQFVDAYVTAKDTDLGPVFERLDAEVHANLVNPR